MVDHIGLDQFKKPDKGMEYSGDQFLAWWRGHNTCSKRGRFAGKQG